MVVCVSVCVRARVRALHALCVCAHVIFICYAILRDVQNFATRKKTHTILETKLKPTNKKQPNVEEKATCILFVSLLNV